MALYDATQYVQEDLEFYRRGTAMILNPERVVITVDGSHGGADKYVKFSGDSYELAEMQIAGSFHANAKERPFMYALWEKINENRGNYAKQIINENMWYDRHQHGWFVEWESICYELENICIEKLMPEVSAEMPPVTAKTQKKKNKYGYGSMTLYASGQLVECIHAEIL